MHAAASAPPRIPILIYTVGSLPGHSEPRIWGQWFIEVGLVWVGPVREKQKPSKGADSGEVADSAWFQDGSGEHIVPQGWFHVSAKESSFCMRGILVGGEGSLNIPQHPSLLNKEGRCWGPSSEGHWQDLALKDNIADNGAAKLSKGPPSCRTPARPSTPSPGVSDTVSDNWQPSWGACSFLLLLLVISFRVALVITSKGLFPLETTRLCINKFEPKEQMLTHLSKTLIIPREAMGQS